MNKKIELLNSEGPILELHKKTIYILKFKQFRQEIEINETELKQFINGEKDVITADNKVWNYNSFSDGMRTKKEEIYNFINN